MKISNFTIIAKKNIKITLIVGFIITFIFGYIVGKEHIKYEIRSGINNAMSEFQDEIGEIFGGGSVVPIKEKSSKKKDEPIGISMTKKNLVKGKWETSINLYFDLTNNLDKDIRAFMGQTVFLDLFDKEIIRIDFTYEDGILAGETVQWEGGLDYNQFMENHQRLASIDLEDVTAQLEVHEVLFTDGAREEY